MIIPCSLSAIDWGSCDLSLSPCDLPSSCDPELSGSELSGFSKSLIFFFVPYKQYTYLSHINSRTVRGVVTMSQLDYKVI